MKLSHQNSTRHCSAVEEPLAESAPIARDLAATYCAAEGSQAACHWYHSKWQYFRLIGLFSSIAGDDDFLLSSLGELAATGEHDRVLITGSADYGMLARVIQSYRNAGREPNVTLIDICRTPLELNQWLARREQISLEVIQGDVLQFVPDQPYDLICSHSFLGRFYGRREKLSSAWGRLLRSDGRLVTTARIRPDIDTVVGFSDSESADFASRAEKLAENCPFLGEVLPSQVAAWAREFARNKVIYPLKTSDELERILEQGRLRVVTVNRVPGRADRKSSPDSGIRSERIRLVAARI
jgi:SAM-dependent methyltransferase